MFIVGGGRGFHRNNTRELRRVELNSCLCQKLLFSLTRCLNSKISRRNYIIPKISSGSKMLHFSICFFFFFFIFLYLPRKTSLLANRKSQNVLCSYCRRNTNKIFQHPRKNWVDDFYYLFSSSFALINTGIQY